MSDTPAVLEPVPAEPRPAHVARSGDFWRFLTVVALVLAALALAFIGWQWHTTRGNIDALRQELARKLAETDAQNKTVRSLADQAREASTEAQVKLGVLENRVAESQNQQIALEALYQELSRNRDEWTYAEIEQSLLTASQQLQLAGNVKAALIALQNADARLQRVERPQLVPVRKAIARDIERLKALPYVDTVGIAVRIDNAIAAIDTLPLAMEVRPPADRGAALSKTQPTSTWQRFWREAWGEMKQLVRVQNMAAPQVPLLAPEQTFFLRENLKLRLIAARLALLAHDEQSFKADLQAAREWLTKYYDTSQKSVGTVLTSIKNLHDSDISIDVPDISGTLDALRASRLTRERPLR